MQRINKDKVSIVAKQLEDIKGKASGINAMQIKLIIDGTLKKNCVDPVRFAFI